MLRRHPEFRKLWAGQTISLVGSQVTLLALPLTAVLVLHASASQLGLLYAAQTAPFLVLGLAAGVWVDRLRRQPILIAADLARAALLGSIPIAAVLGVLSLAQLYLLGLLVGLCTVFFDVAYQSFLPVLVGREHLVEGNSRLEISRSTAQIAGPGLGGVLVQLLTPPLAVVVDAGSFLVSAVFLLAIRSPEAQPIVGRGSRASGRTRPGFWAELREGLAVVVGNPLLRRIAACTSTSNLFGSAQQAILVLYATRDLGLPAAVLGFALAAGSVGALLAALLTTRLTTRFGLGPGIVGGISLGGVGSLLLAVAGGPVLLAAALVALGYGQLSFGSVLYNVNQVSLRQAITPDHVQGRMNATMRFLVWGTLPIGALVGGVLGESVGLRSTLGVVAVGALLTPLWVVLSPVRRLRELPSKTSTGPGDL